MRRLSPARREHTALTPGPAGFPGARDCPERGAPRTWVRKRRLRDKVGCLGKPPGLGRLNTGARGRILNNQAQILELVADGIGQAPVLGGTGLGTGS